MGAFHQDGNIPPDLRGLGDLEGLAFIYRPKGAKTQTHKLTPETLRASPGKDVDHRSGAQVITTARAIDGWGESVIM